MPRDPELRRVMVLGSGPIVIGQAGEFDYSGTQACRALREEGIEVVLVNSNPATIMTDPATADRTYVEPLDLEAASAVIAREGVDALLPVLGGQTALNLAMALESEGVLDKHGVRLIGADSKAIERAEDRLIFRETMERAGLRVPRSRIVTSVEDAVSAADDLGLPLILRPGYTLGGEGGGVATTREELASLAGRALRASPIGQTLVEESVLGWAELELEVMRDKADNAVVICSIENLDPMGVHTGDSVTVAPAMTLSDEELQKLRDASLAVIRAVGVETGGSNVQFALNRSTGDVVVIEMNPRVSRSSALASKATGFPIAKVAARLAIGYTLDELPNEITAVTPASFEPTLDYVALKMPRFAFEKMPGSNTELTTHMKSVGEVLALGRTFGEAFGKAMSARELDVPMPPFGSVKEALERLRTPSWDRFDVMVAAFREGASVDDVAEASGVDTWFCREIEEVARASDLDRPPADEDRDSMLARRRAGATDASLARSGSVGEVDVVHRRRELDVRPTFHAVDTCAAEFAAVTPYFYSAFDTSSEVDRGDGREAIVVLGSGPNRIGQGIEFDYCCVHAAETVRDLGYAAVMVNCNPETVSTDHGVSDRLYLEPVTIGSVLDVCEVEKPVGVIAQLGGQTPLRLAPTLAEQGVPVLGTGPDAIDLAEDRGRFGALLADLGLSAPPWALAETPEDAVAAAREVGYPVLARPSYVLGGRAMALCHDEEALLRYLDREGVRGSLLIDRYLDGAVEYDVDALSDGRETWIAGIMEHVEAAGVHSGDSACVLPPQRGGPGLVDTLSDQASALAEGLGAVGLVNVQFAVRGRSVHVIEANPRASRTVPFVAKATGVPLVRHAVRLMLGTPLADLGLPAPGHVGHVAVKEAVLPFSRFPETDPILGPEMRATGEVMGLGGSFAEAFSKAQRAAGAPLPSTGTTFISARDADKPRAVLVASKLVRAGHRIAATTGTARAIEAAGIPASPLNRIADGPPHAVELIEKGGVDMIINTPTGGTGPFQDGARIRQAAIKRSIPCLTSMDAAEAAADALVEMAESAPAPVALQDLAGARG